jgi:hypothetical protein
MHTTTTDSASQRTRQRIGDKIAMLLSVLVRIEFSAHPIAD